MRILMYESEDAFKKDHPRGLVAIGNVGNNKTLGHLLEEDAMRFARQEKIVSTLFSQDEVLEKYSHINIGRKTENHSCITNEKYFGEVFESLVKVKFMDKQNSRMKAQERRAQRDANRFRPATIDDLADCGYDEDDEPF